MSKKRIALLMAVVMVLGVAVGSTMAWLTDKTGDVTNTFTVGDINIKLQEHKVNTDGKTIGTTDADLIPTETQNGNAYHFVPGDTLQKDPFVTVEAKSEKCYVFIKVSETNNIELTKDNTTEKAIKYDIADGWTEYPANSGYYYQIVDQSDKTTDSNPMYILKDNKVTVSSFIEKSHVELMGEGKNQKPVLTFTAAAVQYDNLVADNESAEARLAAAWENLPAEFKPTP